MNLNDAYTNVFFSRTRAPETFQLVLRLRGQEITDGGYQAVTADPKQWRVGSGEATFAARFGPFPAGARFDEAAIIVDGAELHSEPMPGSVPPTGTFEWTATLVVVS